MNRIRPNRLGWITSCNVQAHTDAIETTTWADDVRHYIPGITTIEADLHIVAQDAGSLMKKFHQWIEGGLQEPAYESEFMCLYCGSPNSIEHTHCKKCGAPRSFVIG